MKRALVSGAAGFVGANLVRRLLGDGHEVHALVRPGSDPWRLEEVRSEVRVHAADLADADAVDSIARAIRPAWVFHLAAHGAYPAQRDARRIVQTNVVGTLNLVEACLENGFEAFVNAGSSSEYGFKDHRPTEGEALEPNSVYAVAKASATLFCRYTARSLGVHLPTMRLYSAYGPYEEPTRLIPTLVLLGLEGRLPSLARPEVARDYVYVEDVVEAFLLAAATPGQEPGAIYNVGTEVQTSLHAVVEVARRVLAIGEQPRWGSMPDRGWDTDVWVADARRIRRDLGWQPRYTFEQGFQATVDWFRENPLVETVYRHSALRP